jgi:hypothetical protein
MAEAMIQFSAALVVKRCNVTESCVNFHRDVCRQNNKTAVMQAKTTSANSAAPNCTFRAQGPEAIVSSRSR